MGILHSVGRGGTASSIDIKVVQAALNLSISTSFSINKLKVDGLIGNKTYQAIEAYQANVVGLSKPDGRVDPGGKTIKSLKAALSKGLSEDALLAIMAQGQASTIKLYLPLLKTAFPKYQINTPLRIAHFLAQVGHESLSLKYTEEQASGSAYENRKDLGNINPGDGERFKGRGLIQLTGRENYAKYGKYIGADLLQKGNETMISKTPRYALDVSLWFWDDRKLNRYADADDIRAITRRVNGGYNGLQDRQAYLDRAKFFLL